MSTGTIPAICSVFGSKRDQNLHIKRKENREKTVRGSVSRVLYAFQKKRRWPFIWDARYRTPRATYPDDDPETGSYAVSIWSCSRRGLPCHCRCRQRGALLPHPFTLTSLVKRKARRFAFCGTFPGVTSAGRYPAPCFRGARTFLPCPLPKQETEATIRPSDRFWDTPLRRRGQDFSAARQ